LDLLRLFNQHQKESFSTKENQIPVIASKYFKKGDSFKFQKNDIGKDVFIAELIPESSSELPLIITDISLFQSLFSDEGFIDELEVTLKTDQPKKDIQILISGVDEKLVLIQQNKNLENKQSLSDAFLVNLQFFSIIAIVISVLLIYQFYRFILIERETDFSKLKSIGMSNRDIFILLFFELVVIGILCGLAGLLLGILVSELSLSFIVSTVNNFYYNVDSKTIYFTFRLFVISILIGVSGCLLAGVHPLLRFLTETSPLKTVKKEKYSKLIKTYRQLFFTGLILLAAIFYILNSQLVIQPLLLSYLSVTFFSAGMFLILPYIINKSGSLISKLKFLSPLKSKASISYINQTLVRQCFFVLSLGILIGFVISLVIFIASFRQTITNWIEQVTPADVYVQSSLNSIQQPYPVSKEVFNYLTTHPFVEKYDYISRYKYSYNKTPLQIRSSRFEILKDENRLKFKSLEAPISKIDEDWLFISEPFQKRYGKNTGDEITIYGDKAKKTFKIMGVFYDYISNKGAILIDVDVGRKLFKQQGIHGITVYNLSTERLTILEKELKEKFPNENLIINTKKELRDATLKTFDRTFYIVWFLAILASLISVVTLINSTSMVFLERLFEFSQLRAVGASTKELLSLLWSQMSILSLYSIIAAYLCSLGFINILDNINWAFFGWSIDLVFSWKPYVLSFILLFILTYLTIKIPFSRMVERMRLYGLRNE
ncbi:MAG: FtsX-like permease family protein, partial [Thermodesulfobacteriota bacterium]